jgi:hypothetical protein
MSIPLSSLSDKLNTNVLGDDIFLISNANSSQDNKITRDELSQSFDSFTAQNLSGFTIFEGNGLYGLSVSGDYGFVGINDRTPGVSLDVVDVPGATPGLGQIRISGGSARKVGISIAGPNVYYQFSKKPNDTKLYIESSVNGGSTFSNLFVADQNGNFGITDSTGALSDKFLVSGASIQFQKDGNALYFDPYNTEIKTSATDEILLLNYNNLGDINLGKNAIYIDNDSTTPKVGVGHTIPAYTMHVSGAATQVSRFETNQTNTSLSLKNTTNTAHIGVSANKMYLGGSNSLTSTNLVYSMAGNGLLGMGTSNPLYKLHLKSTSAGNTLAYFETDYEKTCEIVIASNKVLDIPGEDTGPRNSFVTFSRYDSVGPDADVWSIGNIYNDTTFGGADDFVFIKNGYFGASPDVVAKLSTAGNLDIDGSYTTSSSYCKGQYIQVHTASLAGTSHIYIDPFGTNASSASNNSNIVGNAPFGVAMYAGSLQRIRFSVTSVTPIANVIFQFYAITPAATGSSTTNNIGDTTDTANVKYTTTIPSLIAGTTTLDIPTSHSFSAGQLLQFRLFTAGPAALTVVVQMTSSFRYIIV